MGITLLSCSKPPIGPRPNILLISIDTLRADHLGCYGHDAATSPFIDRLAAKGVRFSRAFATAPNTAPSHLSVMLSLYPTAHAVPNASSNVETSHQFHFPDNTTSLPQLLKKAGYQTVAFADGGNVSRENGLDRGFDVFRSHFEGIETKVNSSTAWLTKQLDRERPWFLFFHTYEVHAPYLPPQKYADRFVTPYDGWIRDFCFDETGKIKAPEVTTFNAIFDDAKRILPDDARFLRQLYDAGIAYADDELARFFTELEESQLTDNLLVVFIADHGEEFGEHGGFGHKQLYDEVTHVPMIMCGPMIEPRVVDDQVSLVDLLPTLLDLMELPLPEQAQGRSLVPLMVGNSLDKRPAFAELITHSPGPILSMVRTDATKLIRYQPPHAKDQDPTPRLRLFQLGRDPMERINLIEKDRELGRPNRRILSEWERANLRLRERFGAQSELGKPRTNRELDELGY